MHKATTKQSGFLVAASVAFLAAAFAGAAQAQGAAHPDLSGNYRCQANPNPCLWPGPTPSIAQSGTRLEIKNDKGEVSAATLTSDLTISAGAPFNSYAVIRPDQSIDWSNGTKWRKQ